MKINKNKVFLIKTEINKLKLNIIFKKTLIKKQKKISKKNK